MFFNGQYPEHKVVDFSSDDEMNHVLNIFGKSQNPSNREEMRKIGSEIEDQSGSQDVTQEMLQGLISEAFYHRLEDA